MNGIGMPVDGKGVEGSGARMVGKWCPLGVQGTSRKRERVKEVVRIRREGGVRATWLIRSVHETNR